MTRTRTRRIVCISDVHERWEQGVLRSKDFPRGNILLVAGDLTFNGEFDKIREFDDWIGKLYFDEVVVIPGNHDRTFETHWTICESLLSNVDYTLDQEGCEVMGLKVWGEPRQPWFYDWAYNVQRADMKDVWAKVPTDTDVLLTHGPPLGAGDLTVRGEAVGCQYQREWIEEHQPRMVVCGHIHSGAGIHMIGRTLVVNASSCNEQYKPVNPPIIINL